MEAAAQHIGIVPAPRVRPGLADAVWRVFERAGAVAGTVLLAPALVGMGAAVAILSGRPPLVAHRRAGRNGHPFWMLKFRTMWDDRAAEESVGCCVVAYLESSEHFVPAPKDGPDPRVTSRLARFLRRYSLDELPQLLHVAAGQMALVGPRPLLPSELAMYYGKAAVEVLEVPPGMTGLWQVMGRSRLSYAQRRRLDLFLVRHNTVGMRFRILAKTLPQVIRGANSW